MIAQYTLVGNILVWFVVYTRIHLIHSRYDLITGNLVFVITIRHILYYTIQAGHYSYFVVVRGKELTVCDTKL